MLRAYTLLLARNPGKYPPQWQPISNDGVFYPTDAREEFLNGEIPFDGTIVVGTNSYEGNVLYMGWNLIFTPENITDYFQFDQLLSQILPVSGSEYQCSISIVSYRQLKWPISYRCGLSVVSV